MPFLYLEKRGGGKNGRNTAKSNSSGDKIQPAL
jgi:hypothetical protein